MKKIILLVLVFLSAISFADEAVVADTAGEKSLAEVVSGYMKNIPIEYQKTPGTALLKFGEQEEYIRDYAERVPEELWVYPEEVVFLALGLKDSFMVVDSTKLSDEWIDVWPFVKHCRIEYKKVYKTNEINLYSSQILTDVSGTVFFFVVVIVVFFIVLVMFYLYDDFCSWRRLPKNIAWSLAVTSILSFIFFGVSGFMKMGLVISAHLTMFALLGSLAILLISKVKEEASTDDTSTGSVAESGNEEAPVEEIKEEPKKEAKEDVSTGSATDDENAE